MKQVPVACGKIVIFHTKYPQKKIKCAPPNLKSWIRPWKQVAKMMSSHAIIPTRIPRTFSVFIRPLLNLNATHAYWDCCQWKNSSKRGPNRRFTDSERKHRKRESNAKLGKSRIWMGDQCDLWNELRSVLRLKTNTEVAKILLDW